MLLTFSVVSLASGVLQHRSACCPASSSSLRSVDIEDSPPSEDLMRYALWSAEPEDGLVRRHRRPSMTHSRVVELREEDSQSTPPASPPSHSNSEEGQGNNPFQIDLDGGLSRQGNPFDEDISAEQSPSALAFWEYEEENQGNPFQIRGNPQNPTSLRLGAGLPSFRLSNPVVPFDWVMAEARRAAQIQDLSASQLSLDSGSGSVSEYTVAEEAFAGVGLEVEERRVARRPTKLAVCMKVAEKSLLKLLRTAGSYIVENEEAWRQGEGRRMPAVIARNLGHLRGVEMCAEYMNALKYVAGPVVHYSASQLAKGPLAERPIAALSAKSVGVAVPICVTVYSYRHLLYLLRRDLPGFALDIMEKCGAVPSPPSLTDEEM